MAVDPIARALARRGEVSYTDTVNKLAAYDAQLAQKAAANRIEALKLTQFNNSDYTVLNLAQLSALTWETSANRLERTGAGTWARVVANAKRRYMSDTGVLLGYIMDGPTTAIKAMPIDNSALSATTGAFTKTVAADTVTLAGTATERDLFGTTGKSARFQQSTTANGIMYPTSTTRDVGPVANGDVVRVVATFHIKGLPTDTATSTKMRFSIIPRARSGTAVGGAYVNFNTNKECTSTTAVSAGNTASHGVDLIDTLPTGEKIYTAWADCKQAVAPAGAISPAIKMTSDTGGTFDLVPHSLYTELNPTTARPSGVPILDDGTYVADGPPSSFGGVPQEIWYYRLACGSSRFTGSKIAPPTLLSARAVPYEYAIRFKPSGEASNVDFFTPNPNVYREYRQDTVTGTKLVRPGPGFCTYDVYPGLPPDVAGTTYTIQGAFSDPRKWGFVRSIRFDSNRVTVSGSSTNFGVVQRASSTTITTTEGSQAVTIVNPAIPSFTMDRFIISGHSLMNNRGWQTVGIPKAAMGNQPGRIYFGLGLSGSTSVPDGAVVNISDGEICHTYDGGGTYAAAGRSCTYTYTGIRYRYVQHDMISVTSSDQTTSLNTTTLAECHFGNHTQMGGDYFNTQSEVEVDIGAGRQPLSASGVLYSALPRNRVFKKYGSRATGLGGITVDPDNDLQIIVTSFSFATGQDKPGYQFVATRPWSLENEAYRPVQDLSVWVSTNGQPASVSNPHIYVTTQYGSWSGGVFTATGAPRYNAWRLHPDIAQGIPGSRRSFTFRDNFCATFAQALLIGSGSGPGNTSNLRDFLIDRNIIFGGSYDAITFYNDADNNGTTKIVRDTIILPFNIEAFTAAGDNVFPWYRAEVSPGFPLLFDNVWCGANITRSAVSSQTGFLDDGSATITALDKDGNALARENAVQRIATPYYQQFDVLVPSSYDSGAVLTIEEVVDFGLNERGFGRDTNPEDKVPYKFSALAEVITGIPLNDIVNKVNNHVHATPEFAVLRSLVDWMVDTEPTHWINVPAATAVGASIQAYKIIDGRLDTVSSTLFGTDFAFLYGGNDLEYFTITNGVLTVAKSLVGVDTTMLLITNQNEFLLVNIQ